jgi:hypothetical protein
MRGELQRLGGAGITQLTSAASYLKPGQGLQIGGTGARWCLVESSSRSSFLFEHDLFGKPVSTFPDHALAEQI